MLLLGDVRAFFALYRTVADAGLRAFQLDRDGALARAGLQVLWHAAALCAQTCRPL